MMENMITITTPVTTGYQPALTSAPNSIATHAISACADWSAINGGLVVRDRVAAGSAVPSTAGVGFATKRAGHPPRRHPLW